MRQVRKIEVYIIGSDENIDVELNGDDVEYTVFEMGKIVAKIQAKTCKTMRNVICQKRGGDPEANLLEIWKIVTALGHEELFGNRERVLIIPRKED